jgi:hypothetical protein
MHGDGLTQRIRHNSKTSLMDTSKRTAGIDPAARSWRGPTAGALIFHGPSSDRGSHAGSHPDERSSTEPDGPELRTTDQPISRTDLNRFESLPGAYGSAGYHRASIKLVSHVATLGPGHSRNWAAEDTPRAGHDRCRRGFQDPRYLWLGSRPQLT